ncbi:MAG: hypothetical protein GX103_13355 [Bacteroidales bacterium]|nr:hypothetical protein [Candidatus Falkowbacteria bacterium]NLO52132.1 hypothetical protein [Bacteroidales bacterium]
MQAPVTVGDWVLTILITAIPLVGVIMLFVWAFSGGTNVSKANWAKAILIWMLVGLVLTILFWGALGSMFMGGLNY